MLTDQINTIRETLKGRLRCALRQPGFTAKRLSDDAGLHRNTLVGCDRDDWNPTNETLARIEPFLPSAPEQVAA